MQSVASYCNKSHSLLMTLCKRLYTEVFQAVFFVYLLLDIHIAYYLEKIQVSV